MNGRYGTMLGVAVALGIVAVWSPDARAQSAARISDGTCRESPEQALADLASDLEAARRAADAATCVSVDSRFREEQERKELASLADAVTDSIADTCAKIRCVSNLMLPACKLDPWGPSCFGGCSNFSLLADDAIGLPRYFSKQRVHQCGPVFCHWVVVLTNDRTGEQVAVDAWKRGGGAVLRGSTDPVLEAISDYRAEYPNPPFIGASDPQYSGFCKKRLASSNGVRP